MDFELDFDLSDDEIDMHMQIKPTQAFMDWSGRQRDPKHKSKTGDRQDIVGDNASDFERKRKTPSRD